MKTILILFFYLFVFSNLHSQTDSSFFFPMKMGDLWQYKEPPPPDNPYIIETRIGRDTTFLNGQTYGSVVTNNYGYGDTIRPVNYERQIGNKVYRYFPNQQKEFLVYDFSKNIGDTVSIFPRSSRDTSIVTVLDAGLINIFGKSRRYMTFYDKEYPTTLYWIDQITDGIGITFSQFEPGVQYSLVGAIIDSTHYGNVTSVSSIVKEIPDAFTLYQNYPNPFNPSTTIYVRIPKGVSYSLFIYNILGERIRTLYNGRGNGNNQNIIWDAKNDSGVRVSSGVYFYQICSKRFSATKKMLLIQ